MDYCNGSEEAGQWGQVRSPLPFYGMETMDFSGSSVLKSYLVIFLIIFNTYYGQ